MNYISTRGGGKVSSSQAVIKGIAENGGLYVPEKIPGFEIEFGELANLDYKTLAYKILSLYFTDFSESELTNCINNAYGENFDTPEIAPLIQKDNVSFLELFHGKTLAFKDMALSFLPHLMKTAAKKNGVDKEIVILTATSGDTGKAALEGFKDVEGIKIIVFYPEDGISVLQSRQMLTQEGRNTYVVGVRGNFDDTQSGVKKIFTDKEFQNQISNAGMVFSSANSINIGRLIPQIVYYYYAYSRLLAGGMPPGEKIDFVVPTGNFGNILAGYYAKLMGLPVNKLICASNDNNVLYDFFKTGEFNINREFIQTVSPSMDILLPSNFERFIYDTLNSTEELNIRLKQLADKGSYRIDAFMPDFEGFYATEDEAREAIKTVYNKYNYIIDPHTAVAYAAYEKFGNDKKTVIIATASPYKFTKTVMTAIDDKYNGFDDFELINRMAELKGEAAPERISDLNKKPVLHKRTVEKYEMKNAVEEILG